MTSISPQMFSDLQRKAFREPSVIEWLENFQSPSQPWKIFLTISMRRLDLEVGQVWNVSECDKAIIKFLWRLEYKVFKNGARRHRRRLGRVVVRHQGDYSTNPHFHCVLTCPIDITDDDFKRRILSTAERIRWISGKPHTEPYVSSGAFSYLFSDSASELVIEALARAN